MVVSRYLRSDGLNYVLQCLHRNYRYKSRKHYGLRTEWARLKRPDYDSLECWERTRQLMVPERNLVPGCEGRFQLSSSNVPIPFRTFSFGYLDPVEFQYNSSTYRAPDIIMIPEYQRPEIPDCFSVN